MNTYTVTLLLAALALSVAIAPGTALQNNTTDTDPETAGEFVSALDSLGETQALAEYSEFEAIQSQAIQELQVGQFEKKKSGTATVLQVLQLFNRTFQAAQQGSYRQALTRANETRALNEQLRDEGAEQYALLSDIGLDRFYEQTAQELQNRADTITRTPNRISVLLQAGAAYREAGASDRFADTQLRVEQLRERFESDYQELNASQERLETFVEDCEDCESMNEIVEFDVSVLEVPSLYSESESALSAGDSALKLANRHNLTNLTSTNQSLTQQYNTAEEYNRQLLIASGAIIMTVSVVLGVLVWGITRRLLSWKRDFVDAHRGEIILMGEMLDG